MNADVWGDGDDGRDCYVTEERCEQAFVDGLQAMREMLARFVEQGGDHVIANSIRLNWNPQWGKDPGRPGTIMTDCWS